MPASEPHRDSLRSISQGRADAAVDHHSLVISWALVLAGPEVPRCCCSSALLSSGVIFLLQQVCLPLRHAWAHLPYPKKERARCGPLPLSTASQCPPSDCDPPTCFHRLKTHWHCCKNSAHWDLILNLVTGRIRWIASSVSRYFQNVLGWTASDHPIAIRALLVPLRTWLDSSLCFRCFFAFKFKF